MNRKVVLIISCLLSLAACDDNVLIARKDWRCSKLVTLSQETCLKNALDVKLDRQGECRMVPIQECVQWTKAD